MEKLCIGLILLIVGIPSLKAQDSLCVFSAKGAAYFQKPGSKILIHKGDFITNAGRLTLEEKAALVTIDRDGSLYYINQPGNHQFKHLRSFRRNQSSFTRRYFTYIWKEMLGSSTDEPVIAGVFRGEIPMLFPVDSARIASSTLHFEWRAQEENPQVYFFLRNKTTQEILKLATNGTRLSLYEENPIFNESQNFEWTVSTTAFPNLKNLPFYQFTRIDRATYELAKAAYVDLIKDLQQLNFTADEIAKLLCQSYGLCK